MGSITLTNIPYFVEQPGRTITKAIGELDRMTVPFLGPWNQQVPFQEGAADTTYPLMFCMGYTEDDNGGLHELKVNYAGVAVTSGAMPYLTQPILSITEIQGSRDFETEWAAMSSTAVVTNVSYSGGTIHDIGTTNIYYYSVGTQRVNIRYIGTSVALRYHTIPQPNFEQPAYKQLGLSLVKFYILSTYYGEVSVAASAVPASGISNVFAQMNLAGVPPLSAAYMGMRITQIGKWYEVEETYAPTF